MIHPYAHYPMRAASRWPDKPALVDGSDSFTYAELDRRVGRLAGGLRALGVERGDRVAVVQENNHRYVESACAIARAGGVLVPLLGALTDREHAFIAADAGARLAIALSPAGAKRAERLRDTVSGGLAVVAPGGAENDYEQLATAGRPLEPFSDAEPGDCAQILYTSGTTGQPKGVVHTLGAVAAAMAAWVGALGVRHDDRLLGQFALSHFGGRLMDASWCVGATLVILPRPDAAEIVAAVGSRRITAMLMVPTLMQALLDHPEVGGGDFSSLRVVLYAAAPASPTLVRRSLAAFGPVLATGFGQTEAYGLNTFLSAADHEAALAAGGARLASIGREAEAGVQVRVLDEDGAEVAPGEVGEICVSAPWVAKGYWNRPDLTAQRFRGGWLRTGDLGRQDAEGYFFLVDRADDMIISGGYNVAPREVEDVIAAVPGVRECCVVGVPDPKWGEAVHAVVVGDGVDADQVISHCRANLAAFKVPKRVELAASLPRSSVGKILRRAVREPFWAGQQRRIHGAE